MSKYEKLLLKILRGVSDKNILFTELCNLLRRLGFNERVREIQHNFYKKGIEEKINLQSAADKAKAYQVRQVRNIITKYNLGGQLNE